VLGGALGAMLFSCSPADWRPVGYTEESFGDGGMKKGPRTVTNIVGNMNIVMPRLHYLYSEARVREPALEGTVHMLMDVDWKGHITYVSVFKTTLNDEIFEDVLEATLIDHSFTKWRRGKKRTEIIYPLEFRAEHATNAPRSRSRKAFEQERQAASLEDEQRKIDEADKAERAQRESEEQLWQKMLEEQNE
jgi:hypothetical protein